MATRKQDTERLAKLMKKIDIAMLTTVGKGGLLASRPLSTQSATYDGERIWFFSEGDSPKVAEIRRQPNVNVAYASKDANTYLSVAGQARISRDRARIEQFWNDALKAFFPNGKDDPNLVLIEVQINTIEYWDGPGSWIGKAITFAVARVTGNDDVMGENRIVDVRTGRSRKPAGSDRPGKAARKRAPAGRATTKKASAKKATAKKATAKKATAKKATAGKSAPGRTVAKKPGAKRASKSVTKRSSAR
jgi:general stress protein 26